VLGDPGAVVTMLNSDLSERMDDGMFLTLFVAQLGEEPPREGVAVGGGVEGEDGDPVLVLPADERGGAVLGGGGGVGIHAADPSPGAAPRAGRAP
jgi:hypothetical protein